MNKLNLVLFDDLTVRENLLPLSFTRPLSHLRVGITTIEEKWKHALGVDSASYVTVDYLSEKFPVSAEAVGGDACMFVAGHVIPSSVTVEQILSLSPGQALTGDNGLVAFYGTLQQFSEGNFINVEQCKNQDLAICMLYDIFMLNGAVLESDFASLTAGRESQPISQTCTVVGPVTDESGRPRIFIEPGATVEGAVLNVKNGPIYIGADAEVMEGCCMRGPVAMLPHSVANMGAKIYGATTLGPYCKVGGELNNVVMIGYSNKAHDGFLGNAVIGKWCNLGAGSVASNLKNDYTEIKLWNYRAHRFLKTGLQFCGLIMGDHSKAGINTMFNTATVLGVGVNIHGSGFPRNFVPSFSEGSVAGFSDVQLTKFFDIARRVTARRNEELTDADMRMFQAIYDIAETYK